MLKISGLSQFQKKIGTQIGIALAIVGVLCFGVLFFGNRIATYAAEIEMLRSEKAEWSNSIESYVSAKTQYEKKGKGYEQVLQNVLPSRDSLINLKKDFQFVASGEGLDLNFSFAGERQKQSPLVGAVGVSLVLEGKSKSDIFSFLEKLEKFRYLFSIESMTLQENKDTVGVTIRGEVLYRN
jgi:Tfp pilus assembly protein PilO